jgi:RecB family endonuclease NucS
MSSKSIGEDEVSASKYLNVLVAPSIGETEELAKTAISQNRTLLIIGRCMVDYHGRARSKLELGERILLVKGDGSLLVHRSAGYEPVNWMPGGNVLFDVRSKDGKLEIRAVRQKPHETVSVIFDKIQTSFSLVLDDSGEFSLYASEEDMQKAILLRPELLEEGFKPITYEKKVEPGFMDVYGEDKNGKLVVVEIKRKTAKKEAVLQLARYIEAVRGRTSREVRGVLVAPNIGKNVQRTLVTLGLEYKHLDPRKCAEILTKSATRKLGEYFSQ